jgi:hypothetical protein
MREGDSSLALGMTRFLGGQKGRSGDSITRCYFEERDASANRHFFTPSLPPDYPVIPNEAERNEESPALMNAQL